MSCQQDYGSLLVVKSSKLELNPQRQTNCFQQSIIHLNINKQTENHLMIKFAITELGGTFQPENNLYQSSTILTSFNKFLKKSMQ